MYLAQVNIAQIKYPLDDERMKDFVDNLDPINEMAENSDGFIWRLKDESGNATNFYAFDDPRNIVNMSVWQNSDALKNYMFRTHHVDFLKRKKEWFVPMAQDNYVLWWVEEGVIPSVEEGIARLVHLRENGDSPYAFTFKSNFQPEEVI